MSTDTICRTIALGVVLVNQILVAFGFEALPWTQDQAYTVASTVATAAVAAWAWWKNNSATKPAIEADEVLGLLRDGLVTIDDIRKVVKGEKDA